MNRPTDAELAELIERLMVRGGLVHEDACNPMTCRCVIREARAAVASLRVERPQLLTKATEDIAKWASRASLAKKVPACRHDELELDVRIASLCDAIESEKREKRALRLKLEELHGEFLVGKRCICGSSPYDEMRCDVGDLLEGGRSALSASEGGTSHSPDSAEADERGIEARRGNAPGRVKPGCPPSMKEVMSPEQCLSSHDQRSSPVTPAPSASEPEVDSGSPEPATTGQGGTAMPRLPSGLVDPELAGGAGHWCDVHKRFAMERYQGPVIGEWHFRCDSRLGGILLPCSTRPFVKDRKPGLPVWGYACDKCCGRWKVAGFAGHVHARECGGRIVRLLAGEVR